MNQSLRSAFRLMRSCVAIFWWGSILLIISLLPSCSQSDSVLSDVNDSEPPVAAASDSVPLLRFSSIAQLEALTSADLPGYEDQPEWRISQLSYECVDTVEMRALVFDVEVRLTSAVTGRTRSVRLKSEVGPELVSVEYYPIVNVVAAHHNLEHSYYFSVQRYRNYSDGSRIGPDEFYDYGHSSTIYYPRLGQDWSWSADRYLPHILGWNESLIPLRTANYSVNPQAQYYSNGTFYIHCAREYSYNVNASIIWVNGKKFSGDDLLPINIVPNYLAKSQLANQETSSNMPHSGTDFNNPHFDMSRGFSMSDPEEAEMATMCKNVPDVSPKPFPKDSRNRAPGFYFARTVYNLIFPDCEELQVGYAEGFGPLGTSIELYDVVSSYLSYFVIDGRLIHYPTSMDLALLGTRITRTKQGSTYKFTRTTTITAHGERWECISDVYIKGVNGVHTQYDFVEENLDNEDREINNALNSRSTDHPELLRSIETDKLMEIDTRLPGSLRDTPVRRTIIPSSK